MLKFFRRIRQNVLMEKLPSGQAGKTGKYFKYAIGEIILVVIGILIALQVNNWNIERTDKDREAKYLSTIVLDLKKDLVRLDYLIKFRKSRVLGDQKLIQQMNGEPVNNLTDLAKNVINSLMEENFSANNTTFLELSNSGNLNLISNDAIKLLLLELEELYKTNNLNIAHETFDYREYISKPASKHLDIEKLFPVFIGQKTVEEQKITIDSFNSLLESKEYKNGLFIMTIMSSSYITSYEKIKSKSETIIKLIQFKK